MANAPKRKYVAPKVRDLKEIEAEYQRVIFEAGQTQYNVHVFSKQLEQLNDRLLKLNQEAHLAKASKQEPKEQLKEEPSQSEESKWKKLS